MAANQIPYDGQAPVNSGGDSWLPQGSLSRLVIQEVSYSSDLGRPECEVVMKGPYKNMVQMASQLNVTSAATWTSFKALASSKGAAVDGTLDPLEPVTQLSATYPVLNYRLEQGQDGAGVHGKLTLRLGVFDSSGGGSPEPIQNSEVWGLTWQPESWDVYRYCANNMLSARHPWDAGSGENDGRTADSVHIQQFLDQSQDTMRMQDNWDYKPSVNAEVYTLNKAERLVAKKKMSQLQPVFHYPVLTKSTTSQQTGGLPAVSNCGEDMDMLTQNNALPAGCPFTFAQAFGYGAWQWIKTGDTINMSRDKSTGTTTFTRTETWNGALSADANFYGRTAFNHNSLEGCRWNFGAV